MNAANRITYFHREAFHMAVITIANNPEFHDLLDLKANIVFSTKPARNWPCS